MPKIKTFDLRILCVLKNSFKKIHEYTNILKYVWFIAIDIYHHRN